MDTMEILNGADNIAMLSGFYFKDLTFTSSSGIIYRGHILIERFNGSEAVKADIWSRSAFRNVNDIELFWKHLMRKVLITEGQTE